MAKKDFTNALNSSDPTMRFISVPDGSEPQEETTKTASIENDTLADLQSKMPEGYKVVRAETKSKRMHIVVTPALYDKIKSKSDEAGLSRNEYINRILERELMSGGNT